MPKPRRVVTGGGVHEKRPDLDRSGHGGDRRSPEATNLASSVDPVTLERDLLTHFDNSQVQRIDSAAKRRSRDDRRATPSPMELTFLATGRGKLAERRVPANYNPALGTRSGESPAQVGTALGGAAVEAGVGPEPKEGTEVEGREVASIQAGIDRGKETRDFRQSAAVLRARPLVPQARAAVPSATRGRANDIVDSNQAVASRVAALMQASTAGGLRGEGAGGEAGPSTTGANGTSGEGSRSRPSSDGLGADYATDAGLQSYMGRLKRRIDDELRNAYPQWAIVQGRSGHVIFEMLIREDGHIDRVRVVRPSGIEEYDRNVVAGVKRIASFGPIPGVHGKGGLRITMSYEALNRAVGIDGPGPGGRGN
jgi:TonB family protein